MNDDPRVLLKKYGLSAKKSWGQNFLVDPKVYEAIVGASVRDPSDYIIEIGAGLGTLTTRLADAVPAGRVIAVERERDMINVLGKELASRKNVEVRADNAMNLNYGTLQAAAGKNLVVVGNLPYQIASPLIFAIIDARRFITRAVVMLQKEMAERLVAAPGTSEYGAMGAMIALYADVKPVIKAKAGAFVPPPRVDSAVVALEMRTTLRVEVDEKQYSRVVHAAFGQRRKTLRNALRALWEPTAVDAALAATTIEGGRRGETLSVEEFARLAGALPEAGHARAS